MPDLVIHLDDEDFHAAHYLATMAASPAAGADTAYFLRAFPRPILQLV